MRIIRSVFLLDAINSERFNGQICASVFENYLVRRRNMGFSCEMVPPLMQSIIQWASYITCLGTE
jgi:hypothetical protein